MPPISALALGINDRIQAHEVKLQTASGLAPFYVILGTIEPRKNHALLLRCWLAMSATLAERTPRLIIIGRRGWNNEAVFNQLDHSDLMGRHVIECNDLNDHDVETLIAQAEALLAPSFAEGFSLPVTEALAAHVPVIASDISVHREVGGNHAEYLPANDDAAWISRLSQKRQPSQQSSPKFSAPTWDAHIRKAATILHAVAKNGSTDF